MTESADMLCLQNQLFDEETKSLSDNVPAKPRLNQTGNAQYLPKKDLNQEWMLVG
jgi:hypothetical protein